MIVTPKCSEPVTLLLYMAKRSVVDVVKNPEMGILSCIIQVVWYNHEGSYEREAEGLQSEGRCEDKSRGQKREGER